jgi:altronate dehydratase large subunit
MNGKESFFGYERPNDVGVRNHVLILPTVACSAKIALRISEAVKGSKVTFHSFGCAQAGEDLKVTYRTLRNTARNPNVTCVLVVSLGCEKIHSEGLADEISKDGKVVELLSIQDVGGTKNAIKEGTKMAKSLVAQANLLKRRAFDSCHLKVAVECGGSDWTSGISANPAVGHAMEMIVDAGGRVIFSETPEIMGAEHILLKRARSKKVERKLARVVRDVEERLKKMHVVARDSNPSRGNVSGGISTLEEKALGAIYKTGSRTLEDVLEYAEEVPRRAGLFFMDTPGQDVESVTGMVAGGAQIVVFTTGLGTPTGNPIAPVIKVTGNSDTFRRFRDNLDLNAGTIIEGKENAEEVGERVFKRILAVASGGRTRAELLGHDEFSILKVWPSF